MTPITINIEWPFALGIIGTLMIIAWFANGRFTELETSMTWVKETLHDLRITVDNLVNPAFGSKSPVKLNEMGEKWLVESGAAAIASI